jgi:tRNA (mo5U34)-methyltransferase
MSVYIPLYQKLRDLGLDEWAAELEPLMNQRLSLEHHGDMKKWAAALTKLPVIKPSTIDLLNEVKIGSAEDLKGIDRDDFVEQLQQLHPWRKGPYSLFGIHIETEWHSDWKWDRLINDISPLQSRKVLDVGGGNGYHGWRMLGAGAELVIGIDPNLLFVKQYQVMQRYLEGKNHYVLPLGIEDLPKDLGLFDTVFSMGVLYHRRSPIDHLYDLRACLRAGGELVLETLIIEGELGEVLMPENRYAKMRNVWFLPSIATMELWLKRSGFKNVRCVDISKTSIEEQRSSDWMRFESLVDYLDPNDHSLTVEGLPAPVRAVFIAEAP